MVILLFLPIGLGVADDDWSKGSFWQNTFGNDAPYFITWYETAELITPLTDVNLYASVFDIDNGTTEINITVYYTFSTFTYENYSVDLVYDSTVFPHTYLYDYLFAGQTSSTTMRYYYQAFDGENIVREGYPTYFEITWSYPPVTIERPIPPDVEYEFELPFALTIEQMLFLFFSLFILCASVFVMMKKSQKYAGLE